MKYVFSSLSLVIDGDSIPPWIAFLVYMQDRSGSEHDGCQVPVFTLASLNMALCGWHFFRSCSVELGPSKPTGPVETDGDSGACSCEQFDRFQLLLLSQPGALEDRVLGDLLCFIASKCFFSIYFKTILAKCKWFIDSKELIMPAQSLRS